MAESIYKWIVPDPVAPEKQPLYKSSAYKQPITNSTLRVGAVGREGTMGKLVKGTVRPDQFVKAHEKTGYAVDATTLRACGRRAGPPGAAGHSSRRARRSRPPPPPLPPFQRRRLSARASPPARASRRRGRARRRRGRQRTL